MNTNPVRNLPPGEIGSVQVSGTSSTNSSEQIVAHCASEEALVVISATELKKLQLPKRRPLLGDWLLTQSLCMVHAWRGVGKTFFSLAAAYAVASGSEFLKWQALSPHRVLFLDGEMPACALQERVMALTLSNDCEPPADFLRFITPDLQCRAMPDLASARGQQLIAPHPEGVDLVIVDNLSCLARSGGKENDSESWLPIADWALEQRAAGRAVLFVHHSGKAGQQRGTSRREDLLDTVISLRRPEDYRNKEGARFIVTFEKARGLSGTSVQDFEVALSVDSAGRQTWAVRNSEDAKLNQILELVRKGANQTEIAGELGITRFQVRNQLIVAKSAGLISTADINDGRRRKV